VSTKPGELQNPEERQIPNGAKSRRAELLKATRARAPVPCTLRPPRALRAVPRSWSFRFLEFRALRNSALFGISRRSGFRAFLLAPFHAIEFL